jgi:hypothetical protein
MLYIYIYYIIYIYIIYIHIHMPAAIFPAAIFGITWLWRAAGMKREKTLCLGPATRALTTPTTLTKVLVAN